MRENIYQVLLVRDNLTRRAFRFDLVLDDALITHMIFLTTFSKVVGSKQDVQHTTQRAVLLINPTP
ncbi:hypothetical protein PPACK8108_LOCUS13552 [Phakopsora pachyrhizi]|uniref:Uncharacterized protein n=1 Tax=Phakopsora pachyrhizi TaxID=170000 RepID=A0AAV0B5S9_PHAPC|nr:hypothetical protein PPACK8108_LOCUS13552 [Phakopsora pachyrhizi]